jgi:hypothetical protein
MVCIGKLATTQTTCLLFKLRDAADKNNVFMICPLHVIDPDTYKIRVQVLLNENCIVRQTLFVTVCLFPVQHTFLDIAMGIIENPEIINENPLIFRDIYLDWDPVIYECLINKQAQILHANRNSIVNNLETKITDVNYELGEEEDMLLRKGLPTPGGFILTDRESDLGLSGSILTVNNYVYGIIIIGSNIINTPNNISYCLAVDMYYILPHIYQCVTAIDRYTDNNRKKLAMLCEYDIMLTFIDDLNPVVNHLGADYIYNHSISQYKSENYINLQTIHYYLDISSLRLLQKSSTNSISIKSALMTNNEFVRYFFNKQQNSVIICKKYNYYDKVLKRRIDIDFVNEPITANILDWCYRGDPYAHLILYLQTKTFNNDGTVILSEPVEFMFNSSPTIDNIHNQSYPRTTLQIPGSFFNPSDVFTIQMNNYNLKPLNGKRININFLNSAVPPATKPGAGTGAGTGGSGTNPDYNPP